MSKIVKIEVVPSEMYVYDPVCSDPHSYIGNGLVNHNCCLWIDEVEKSLSGTKSSNFSDGGTLARVFGTLLTAMQDGLEGVTILATANDISMLPPEFIRRFNEVFFVGLPGPDERWEIFSIHLSKRKRSIKTMELNKNDLLNASEGFTGAEIEKAIKDAIAYAFDEGKGDLTANHILNALSETKPISVVMADKIKKMQEFAKERARYASSWAEEQSKTQKVLVEKKQVNLENTLDDMEEITSSNKKEKKSAKSRMSSLLSEDTEG
jgi:hypothetical protein